MLERGEGLDEAQVLEVLRLPDERLDDALALAHEVRMRWCGPEVEVEGIVSREDGRLPGGLPLLLAVRALRDARCAPRGSTSRRWSRRPARPRATGATEFCIVAAVRGPDERLMAQVRDGVAAIRAAVDINVACSLGILTARAGRGARRRSASTATTTTSRRRARYFPQVVTTHTWEERWETLELVRELGMEVCCGCIIGMGETLEQRAELAAQLAALDPDEVPLNFLDPRPGTPFARPARRSTPPTRCARSRRSGWRSRARSCASPAAAS